MSKQNGGGWKDYWENCERMFTLWQDSLSQFRPDNLMEMFGEKGKDKETWQGWWKTQEKMHDAWKDAMTQFRPEKMMEMFTGQGKDEDLWSVWWKNQVNMTDFWKDSLRPDKMMELFSGQGKDKNPWQDWYKTMAENLREYMKWSPTSVGKDTYEKVLQGSDLYMKVFSFWMDLLVKMPIKLDAGTWKESSTFWMRQYNQILDSFFALHLPEPTKELLKNLTETTETSQQVFLNFYQPWFDTSEELREKFSRSLKGDKEAYTDFLRDWREVYQETFGKVFRMPAFGLSRESFEKLTGSMDSYIHYISSVNEFYTTLYKIGYDAMEKLVRKIPELSREGMAPETFKDFYHLWWQTNEEAYLELFQTESYAKLQGEMLDSWVQFKKHYDQWLGEFFGKLPVPTYKEMDSLYKSVYQLKKGLKEQALMIKELNEKLDALSFKGKEGAL